jgi:hypothetical protein
VEGRRDAGRPEDFERAFVAFLERARDEGGVACADQPEERRQ